MSATPVLAFVWSDHSHASELEAFFREPRGPRRRPRAERLALAPLTLPGRSTAGGK